MDSINFLGKADFPISSQTMDMLQGMTQLAGTLAILGGPNYILTGCNESEGGTISPGIIVIGGQPYNFLGGNKKAKITIQETKETLIAFGVEYPEARTKRVVAFSDSGEYTWVDFERVPTNLELKALFQSIKGDAPGTVKMWAGQVSKIPVGYMLCNGDELLINDFPDLFETVGISFGGDGLNNFKLPDLRGRFIVGFDSSQGSDYNNIGNKGGSDKVALTADQMAEHDHTDRDGTSFNKLSARAADIDATNTPSGVDDKVPDAEYRVAGMTSPQWAEATIRKVGKGEPHENRPPFFTLAYIIKVTV